MPNRDLICGVLLMAAGIFLLRETSSMAQPFHAVDPGPAFFVRIVLVLLIGFSALLTIRGARAMRAGEAGEAETAWPPPRVWAAVGLFPAFYLALPIVGYMPAITGLVVLAMLVCGDRSLLRIAVTSAVAMAFLHLVFSQLFLVTFP